MSSISRSRSLRQDRGNPRVIAIIAAAGKGTRFGGAVPKQFCDVGGGVPLRRSVELFLSLGFVSGVVCVIPEACEQIYESLVRDIKSGRLLPFVVGGLTRQKSVRNGLLAIKPRLPEYVLIHDACRCYCSRDVVSGVYGALLNGAEAVVPTIAPVDSVRCDGKSVSRSKIGLVQTPQGFRYETIAELHDRYANEEFADDASLCDRAGIEVVTVNGSIENKKITYRSDVQSITYRIGCGYDAHKFSGDASRKLYIMGQKIDGYPGLAGVSDADVGVHSLVDAILGALCLGSIGEHFPETDPKNEGIASTTFLEHCRELLVKHRASIVNIDTIIICEKPRISDYSENMKEIVARCLHIEPSIINIKGKTTEGMGFEGRGEGISAISVVTLRGAI